MNLASGHSLSIVLSSGADTDVSVSYSDIGRTGTALPGTKNTAFTASTTGTQILAGPSTGGAVRQVDSLVVRNIDSSSQDVSIKHSDGTTTVVVRKVTLAGGGELHYDLNTGFATISASEGADWTTVVLSADVANSANNTLADVTGLSFAVDSGDTYEFEARVDYTAAATTTGSRWTVNGPAMTRIAYESSYPIDATSRTVNNAEALQIPAAANASSLAAGNVAKISGFFTPSAGGTFAVQSASEVNTSAITAKAGSTLRWRKVVNA